MYKSSKVIQVFHELTDESRRQCFALMASPAPVRSSSSFVLLAAISLPRVTSELEALTQLCVRQASFEGLVCALETHVQAILQCVVVYGFATFPVSRKPRMNFCCIQQNAPNQRLPQPDFCAQSNGSRSPQSTGISSFGLACLDDPHLCLCARISLGLHLTPKVLNNCGGSNCFTSKCELVCYGQFLHWCEVRPVLQLQPGLPACFCSHVAFQTRALATPFQRRKIRRLTKSSTKQRSDRSNLLTVFPR